jgi:hypothetical protein
MTTPSLETLLLLGRGVFLVLSFVTAAIAFTLWRRAAALQNTQLLAAVADVAQRVTMLEGRIDAAKLSIAELGERLAQVPQVTRPLTAAAAGYQAAIRLARSGASQQELIAGCGLSSTEAELIQRLHGPAEPRRSARRAQAA